MTDKIECDTTDLWSTITRDPSVEHDVCTHAYMVTDAHKSTIIKDILVSWSFYVS